MFHDPAGGLFQELAGTIPASNHASIPDIPTQKADERQVKERRHTLELGQAPAAGGDPAVVAGPTDPSRNTDRLGP